MFTIIGADGKEYGPVSLERLREWIAQNRVNLNTQARREGGYYQPLREHPEFAPPPLLAPTPVAAPEIPPVPELPPPPAADTTSQAAVDESAPSEPAVPSTAAPLPQPAAPIVSAAFASTLPPVPPPPPPGAPGAWPAPYAAAAKPETIEFTGEWKEYFKIWIVNVLLTIATLGIYAAWAKVRKRRYFYANTRVCGHAFEYLADPVKILVGNVIVAILFTLYVGSQAISPLLYLCALAIVAVLTPWFVMRAHAFNARNTAWRGLRFNFKGGYGGAAAAFLGWPLLLGCSGGLLYPIVTQKQKEYLVRHHAFGSTPFQLSTDLGRFFIAFLLAALFFLPVIGAYIFLIVSAVVAASAKGIPPDGPPPFAFGVGLAVFFGVAALCAFLGTQFWRARVFNLVWNGTAIGGHTFLASMRARDLIWLQLVNALVSLVTFGFLHPWGVLRKVRFQLSCLQVVPAGNLDAFVAESQPAGSAIGDSAGDLFDFDIGFGV